MGAFDRSEIARLLFGPNSSRESTAIPVFCAALGGETARGDDIEDAVERALYVVHLLREWSNPVVEKESK